MLFLLGTGTVGFSGGLCLAVEVLDLGCRFGLVAIRFLLGFDHLVLLLGHFNILDFRDLAVFLLFLDSVVLGDRLGRTGVDRLGLVHLLVVAGPLVEVDLYVVEDSHRFNNGLTPMANRGVLAFIDGFLGNSFDFLHDFQILVNRVSHVKSSGDFSYAGSL